MTPWRLPNRKGRFAKANGHDGLTVVDRETVKLQAIFVISSQLIRPANAQETSSVRPRNTKPRKRKKLTTRAKKKDPLFVDGKRPRPMYVDYKDVEMLKKLINRHGRIVGRRKTGCSAASQHVVTTAIKRARFMALLPYTGE